MARAAPRTRLALASLAVFMLGPWIAGDAAAHTRSRSHSSWRVEGEQVRMTFSVRSREVTRLPLLEGLTLDLDELIASHLLGRATVRSGERECAVAQSPRALSAKRGYQRVEMRFECPRDADLSIEISAFFEVAPSHVHFARVRVDDRPPVEYLFTESRRVLRIAADHEPSAPRGTSFAGYVQLGVAHISTGLDHLAFLVALLLLSARLRDVAFIVTGFTLGHSLTLSLAVLGWVTPDAALVEALIGFTIALVAAENVGVISGEMRRIGWTAGMLLLALAALAAFGGVGPSPLTLTGLALFATCYMSLVDSPRAALRIRPMLTALFGLVHGFGFASMLLEVGVPDERLLSALFGFNLGVEIGQLAIVTAMWILASLALARWRSFPRGLAVDLTSAALCALGLFWFVQRGYASG